MADLPMEVGPAEPSHADAIVDLIRDGLDSGVVGATVYGCSGMSRFVREQIAAASFGGDSTYTVARCRQEVIGVVEFRVRPHHLFLNYIAVERSWRSQGVAQLLLRSAISDLSAPTQTEMVLDVFADNTHARAWYERLGFVASATNEWWTTPLAPDSTSETAVLTGLVQARATLAAFGFGQLRAITLASEYEVGLLGSRWFRLTDASALEDRNLEKALFHLDPKRRILAVIATGTMPPPRRADAMRLALSDRMHAPLAGVLDGLGEARL